MGDDEAYGSGAGDPDFPLASTRVPPVWDAKIAISLRASRGRRDRDAARPRDRGTRLLYHGKRRELVRPALLLLALVALQVTLGALTVLSKKQFVINSLHVFNGALVLVTSLVLSCARHRPRFAGR